MAGIVIDIKVNVKQRVKSGEELIIMEAMKMENAITAPEDSIIISIEVTNDSLIQKDDVLFIYDDNVSMSEDNSQPNPSTTSDKGALIDELKFRQSFLADENRPAATEKRKSKGYNTARENLHKLVDQDSFLEYGSLVIAAQQSRRSKEDLIKNTPADGLICGTATINAMPVVVMIYDYAVLAGTQGTMNHMKMDRMLQLAHKKKLPVILFAEGGGGRPGDVDQQTIAGLHISTFYEFGKLNGIVPVISVVNGYCFAGNAALAGSSDVIIATKTISLGMGGPAMIEGGGLGKVHPKEVGPIVIHLENGVIDLEAKDEDEAISLCQQYLSYFQGTKSAFTSNDQLLLRDIVPENRKRAYDIREIIDLISDKDEVLELRQHYGKGLVTSLIRIKGIPFGLMANDNRHEAGAITADNAIKANEFMTLCNTHNIALLSLVDTPGIMVGPESEKTGNVKHASRLFVTGAKITVPFIGIVIRRAYGLGAMAMLGGSTKTPDVLLSWPTGEFGAMGLEGAVKLGFRKELEAISDPIQREKLYDKMVAEAYERGKALSLATMFEIDEVSESY